MPRKIARGLYYHSHSGSAENILSSLICMAFNCDDIFKANFLKKMFQKKSGYKSVTMSANVPLKQYFEGTNKIPDLVCYTDKGLDFWERLSQKKDGEKEELGNCDLKDFFCIETKWDYFTKKDIKSLNALHEWLKTQASKCGRDYKMAVIANVPDKKIDTFKTNLKRLLKGEKIKEIKFELFSLERIFEAADTGKKEASLLREYIHLHVDVEHLRKDFHRKTKDWEDSIAEILFRKFSRAGRGYQRVYIDNYRRIKGMTVKIDDENITIRKIFADKPFGEKWDLNGIADMLRSGNGKATIYWGKNKPSRAKLKKLMDLLEKELG